jgi:hypothetical protein
MCTTGRRVELELDEDAGADVSDWKTKMSWNWVKTKRQHDFVELESVLATVLAAPCR